MKDENRELNLYLKQISKIPFLDKEEEKVLFRFILNGNRKAVAEKAKKGDKKAQEQLLRDKESKQKIVESHLWLTYKMANKYSQDKNLSLFDLMQEGTISLYGAIDRFDPERGCRFCFYAQYWIRSYLNSSMKRNRKREMATVSLNAPLDRKDGGISTDPLIDSMPDKKIPNPEKAVQERELKEKANQVLSTLKSREEKILQMRCNNISLEEIGGKFSVSRQRIEKIEKRAISKLQKGQKREMLQGFV